MKKSQKLLLAVLVVSSLACLFGFSVMEGAEARTHKANLIGDWSLKSYELSIRINGLDIYDYLLTTAGYNARQAENTKKLFEETFSGAITDYQISFGPEGSYASTVQGGSASGTWNTDGHYLTLSGTDRTKKFTIHKLTSDYLHFHYSDILDLDLNDDQVMEKVLITSTFEVEKSRH